MEQTHPTIPVTLVRGLLEAGKTTWIRETLQKAPVPPGERLLLIACEEGLEEWDETPGVTAVLLDGEAELDRTYFTELEARHRPTAVLIECNAMWRAVGFAMPRWWRVVRTVALLDGSMLPVQLGNLRAYLGPMLARCDEIHVNRLTVPEQLRACKASLRPLLDRPEAVYLHCRDGEYGLEDVPDLVPYDLERAVVPIAPEHFVYWFYDCRDHPGRYEGKIVALEGTVKKAPHLPPGVFALGRVAVTCCEADMQFLGYLGRYDAIDAVAQFAWVAVEAKITYRYLRQYGGTAPFLEVLRLTETPPEASAVPTGF